MRVGKPAVQVAVTRVDSIARTAAETVRQASASDAGALARFLQVFISNLAPGTAGDNTSRRRSARSAH
jgi:hypothetical protein